MQARPNDYPSELLQTQFVISFHKHWMINPVDVYKDWFALTDRLMSADDSTKGGKGSYADDIFHSDRVMADSENNRMFHSEARDEF